MILKQCRNSLHLYYNYDIPLDLRYSFYCFSIQLMIAIFRGISHQVLSRDGVSQLSKVRGAILPQEYTLSRFVSNLTEKDASWSDRIPACDWKHVECDSHGQVVSLEWENHTSDLTDADYLSLGGQLLWEHIPQTLVSFHGASQYFMGPVALSLLPPLLRTFIISYNAFNGELDLTHLPCKIQVIWLNGNQFTGKIDLTSLPASIQTMNLSYNKLCGNVDLSKLPANLIQLVLSGNYFDGSAFVPENVKL